MNNSGLELEEYGLMTAQTLSLKIVASAKEPDIIYNSGLLGLISGKEDQNQKILPRGFISRKYFLLLFNIFFLIFYRNNLSLRVFMVNIFIVVDVDVGAGNFR